MLTDYHTHSYRCGHATGSMEEYIESAIRRGIDEIGLTDHLYLYFQEPDQRNSSWAMGEQEYGRHYEEMLELRGRYRGKIAVRVGVEADFVEGREDALRSILRRYDFDFILGSVHFVDGWPIDAPEFADRYSAESVAGIYRRYYQTLQKAVRSGMFDLLAHFDLPKKFGFLPEEDLRDVVAQTLDLVGESGIAVELSTGGLRKVIGEVYPSPKILRQMRERDIPIALCSDAHDPREVGFAYEEAITLARSVGYDSLVVFDGGARSTAPLPTR